MEFLKGRKKMSKKLRVLTLTLIGALCISLTACGEEQPLQSSDEIRKDLKNLESKILNIAKFCVSKTKMDNPNLSVMKNSDFSKLLKESNNCLSQNGFDDLNVEVDKKTNQLKEVLQKEGFLKVQAQAEVDNYIKNIESKFAEFFFEE